jgi:O-antigen ligase
VTATIHQLRAAAGVTQPASARPFPLQTVAIAAVFAFLIAVPGINSLVGLGSGHDLARIAQWLLASLCAAAVLVQLKVRDTSQHEPADWHSRVLLLLMVGLGTISIAGAPAPQWAMREASVWLGMFAVGIVVARATAARQRDLAWAMTGAMALYGVGMLCFVLVGMLVTGKAAEPRWVSLHYGNYRLFNHVQTVALPLLAGIVASSGEARLLRVARVALVVNVALLLFLAGRGTMLAVTGASLFVTLAFRQSALTFVRSLVVGAAGGLLLWAACFVALPWMLSISLDLTTSLRVNNLAGDSARFFLWSTALKDVQQAPWFGTGPMHYAHYATHANEKAAHPHNFYLQVAAEWGVPFLLAGLALAALAYRKLLKRIRQTIDWMGSRGQPEAHVSIGVALAATLLGCALDALVSGNLVMPVSQVWFAVAVGWAYAWVSGGDSNRPCGAQPHRRGGAPRSRLTAWPYLGAALLASQAWLGLVAGAEALSLTRHLDSVRQTMPSIKAPPRFWSRGWF